MRTTKYFTSTTAFMLLFLFNTAFSQTHFHASDGCNTYNLEKSDPTEAMVVNIGIDTMVCSSLYVVYSGQTYVATPSVIKNTSNIFVIKGLADTVWIFNMGYGDPLGDDTLWSPLYTSYRTAMADAKEVDSVITDYLGMNAANVKLQIIVPHFHFDHVNNEFPTCLFDSLGYSRNGSRIIIHNNEYYRTTCNQPCCGSLPCNNIGSYLSGGPYSSPWSAANSALFTSTGSSNDIPCTTQLFSFQSVMGTWNVFLQDTSHTAGTLLLENNQYQIRLEGSGDLNASCSLTPGWYEVAVHKNIENNGFDTVFCSSTGLAEMKNTSDLFSVFPNPSYSSITIEFTTEIYSDVLLEIKNIHGAVMYKILAKKSVMEEMKIIDVTDFADGLYFITISANSKTSAKKLIIQH